MEGETETGWERPGDQEGETEIERETETVRETETGRERSRD